MSAAVDKLDPFLRILAEYRTGIAVFDERWDGLGIGPEADALAEVTWKRPLREMETAPPVPTTLQGAIEAVRFVALEEEGVGSNSDLTIKVLRAALVFFDQAATDPDELGRLHVEGGAPRLEVAA